ncbi:TAP-like protein-domain-containing protein [Dichotomopilus funicola]|uniref:TAP-like protein-domain-containing protein n=1 Tax=Dichotomopilus funicola TaxID=1934379 RepID=A0AAN6UYH9_9PEZI|nr:TAP-like protein-domain-containing protein [Dichotomopilus funicola]
MHRQIPLSLALLATTPSTTAHSPLPPRQSDQQPPTPFNWSSITPTPDLQYHSCYETFLCARLAVPLDWSLHNNDTDTKTTAEERKAAIAILTLPATVPVTDPSYAGPLLVNPGGPGAPGTDFVLQVGAQLQAIADTSSSETEERHFDIVGFDPRGVGVTTPSGSCYTHQYDRAVDAISVRGLPGVGGENGEIGVQMRFEMGRGLGELCHAIDSAEANDPENEGGKAFRYLSTAAVARDMLEIVERSWEVVKAAGGDGKGWVSEGQGGEEEARLQYLGLSYGSLLGNVFASLWPGRVGRMVVDGIMDAEDYLSAAWSKSTADAETSVTHFYTTCFTAGPLCPLYQSTDTSPSTIQSRINTLLTTLQSHPTAALHNNRVYPITSYHLSEKIRTSLYAPLATYPILAQALADALQGNFTAILSDPNVMGFDLDAEVCAEIPDADPPVAYTFYNEVAIGIICGDSQPSAGVRDLPWAQNVTQRLLQQAPTVGEGWAKLPLSCAEWPFTPAYTFTGPFGSGGDDDDGKPATGAPLLILTSQTDPATPVGNAYDLAKVHEGAAVVEVSGVGHTVLLSTASECANKLIRGYLATGEVPESGTVCEADCVPGFEGVPCDGVLGG